MILIDWSKFLPALLLLLTPIALFHGRQVRHRALPQDWSGYWQRTFSLGLHTIDFGRAMLGAWCLAEALTAHPSATGFMRFNPVLAKAGVLALAAALQTFVCKEPDSAHAPFAFLGGLVLGFLPFHIASFSLLIAIVVAAGTRAPTVFFPVLSLAVVIVGALFEQKKLLLVVSCTAVVVGLPWLLVLLFPRQWVVTHVLKRTGAPSTPPDELR